MELLVKSGNLEGLAHEANLIFVGTKTIKSVSKKQTTKGQAKEKGSLSDAGAEKKSKNESSLVVFGGTKSIQEVARDLFDNKIFTAGKNDVFFLRNSDPKTGKHLMLASVGDVSKMSMESVRRAAAAAQKSLQANKVSTAGLCLDSLFGLKKDLAGVAQAAAEGILLSSYQFVEFKTKNKDAKKYPSEITLVCAKKAQEKAATVGCSEGSIIASAVNFSRWLGDNPGNKMPPRVLADQAVKACEGLKIKTTVWNKARIKKENMGMLLGVSEGSTEEPRLIIMEYNGGAKTAAPICFVGKGLTFDAGGINIKPSSGMEDMKFDMCGGATVIALMTAIAKLKLKVNVLGVVPSSENLLGPSATKPGDIHEARNGTTVEINNTDAEGRLILGDALLWACEQKPAWIVDIATLTGAMLMALGNIHTGYFSRDAGLAKKIDAAAEKSGELLWEMPMCEEHLKDMKGVYADLTNASSISGAGSAKGAVFLGEFVDKSIPWAHFDIAGTGWHIGNRVNYSPAKGASGAMLRTLLELARAHKA